MQPRIQPLEPPYSPEVAETLQKWMPPGVNAEPLSLFRILAHNLELMSRMRTLGAGLLGKTSQIDPKEREIVIDRVCARCGCEYEWGVHVASFGVQLGIPQPKLTKTVTADHTDHEWAPRESLLVQLVDELHDTSKISDALWLRLCEQWDTPQLLELITIVGWYHVISYLANAARIPPESWAARFPLA